MILRIAAILVFICIADTSAASNLESHNVIGCRIYSMEHVVLRNFPGQICAFSSDGSYVSSQPGIVSRFDGQHKNLWTKQITTHHQINLSKSESEILLMSSEIKEKVRYDLLLVLSSDGKEKSRFSLFDHRKVIADRIKKDGGRVLPGDVQWIKHELEGVESEFSHVNSFYEVPKLKTKLGAKWSGGYIVNSLGLQWVWILDRNLKSILWSISTLKMDCAISHDAQVLDNGNILFYCNRGMGNEQSTLKEYDPVKKKVVWIYPPLRPSPQSMSFENSGGVQRLQNGNTLFNDLTKDPRGVEVDAIGKQVWSINVPFAKSGTANPTPFQQIKRFDLENFLTNNQNF